MSAFLAPLFGAGWQGFDNQGNVLAGGKLYTYQAGTTSPYATWSDFGLTIPNGNPIILNSAGRPSSEIWFDSSSYKVVLTDTNNNIIGTWDNLVGMGSGAPGPQGTQGPQGPQGFTGAQGPLGFGPSGTDGMDGDDGQPIPGPKGNPGAQGVQGLTGPYNMPGMDGVDGDDGMQIPGGVGPQGNTGAQGPQGFTGAQGPLGFGPSGTDGMDGDDGMHIPGAVGITITDDTTTNATRYLTFTSATSGSITGENTSSTKLQFNPSTGILTSTGFSGALNGSVGATTPNTGTFTVAKATEYTETQTAISASAIDLTLGNYFTKTISTTITFTISNTASSGTVNSFILDLTNGGSATVTWWTGVKWAGGTAPTLTSSGRDVLGFFTEDGGTTWNGFVLGKAMA